MIPINYWKLFTQGPVDKYPSTITVENTVLDKMTCYNTNDVKLSSRRQYHQANLGLAHGGNKLYFHLLIPDEWEIRPEWINIHDIHTRHGSPSGQSMNMYIVGSKFRITFPNQYGGPNIGDYSIPFNRGVLYRFDCTLVMSPSTTRGGKKQGYYRMLINGEQQFKHIGNLIWDGDEEGKGMYVKLGPYVGRGNWPEGVNSRTLYLRV